MNGKQAAVLSLIAILAPSVVLAQHAPAGVKVVDVTLPFPGIPEQSVNRHAGGTIESYQYAPPRSTIRYAAQVYQDMPRVPDPPASILRGFTRGHRVIQQRRDVINGIDVILVTMESNGRTPHLWYLIAFEHKSAVYIWMMMLRSSDANGNEADTFLESVNSIRIH